MILKRVRSRMSFRWRWYHEIMLWIAIPFGYALYLYREFILGRRKSDKRLLHTEACDPREEHSAEFCPFCDGTYDPKTMPASAIRNCPYAKI